MFQFPLKPCFTGFTTSAFIHSQFVETCAFNHFHRFFVSSAFWFLLLLLLLAHALVFPMFNLNIKSFLFVFLFILKCISKIILYSSFLTVAPFPLVLSVSPVKPSFLLCCLTGRVVVCLFITCGVPALLW